MGLGFAKNKISTAVLLCGGHNSLLTPLIKDEPVCMLPVFNKRLIEYTIEFLAGKGIEKVIICASKGEKANFAGCTDSLMSRSGHKVRIQCFEEDRPRGTAGILRDIKDFIKDDSFLLINGNTFMSGVDFDAISAEHFLKNSAVTIAVKRSEWSFTEGISVNGDGMVSGFSAIHSSRERRSSYEPLGVYLFDHKAIEHVRESGYFDIKEQLIPALRNASMPVHIFEIDGYCRPINSVDDYFGVHRDNLFNGHLMKRRMHEIAEDVWTGDGVTISPTAFIIGPVVIGNNTRISKGAQIIGPAVIGDNCIIGERAKVRESIIWEGFEMEEGSSFNYSIGGRGLKVRAGDSFDNKIIVDELKFGDMNLISSRYEFNGVVESVSQKMGSFKYAVSIFLKRLMDVTASCALFLLLSPVMLLLALAVKLDSDGPALFCQKRCGKNGEDFAMYKFRTMVKDAAGQQKKLTVKNNIDGPMFKLVDDPRITRVGKFLRKTSLDELPQLLNVLKGEMSLVGPRPLIMDEMKFSPSWRSIRLKVKPGITGLWQIQGRSEASFHDWIRHDVYYVKNQSLWLDIKILLKTFSVVFRKVGAY